MLKRKISERICDIWLKIQPKNCLRYVGSVMVIVDLKMKDAKELSLKENGTGMGI